jgi:DNA uptake protein ComE-like DNA-binding protein
MTQSAQNAVHGPRRFDRFSRSRPAGQSLIVALVLLGFLTAVMGTVTVQLLTESSISNARHTEVTAFYIARAGIEAGLNQLLRDKSPGYEGLGDPWHSSQNEELRENLLGGNQGHTVGLYKVAYFDVDADQERIGIADEESKLNINTAEKEMLHRLDPAFTDDFVKAIMERRQQRLFLTLNELKNLNGAPPNFLTKARESLLTVWGDGKVNINTAPRAVLASLGMDEEHVKKIEELRKGADMGAFKTLGDAASYLGGIDAKWLTTSSSHFSITAQGYLVDDPEIKCKLREVVQRGPEGLQVLRFEQLPF